MQLKNYQSLREAVDGFQSELRKGGLMNAGSITFSFAISGSTDSVYAKSENMNEEAFQQHIFNKMWNSKA